MELEIPGFGRKVRFVEIDGRRFYVMKDVIKNIGFSRKSSCSHIMKDVPDADKTKATDIPASEDGGPVGVIPAWAISIDGLRAIASGNVATIRASNRILLSNFVSRMEKALKPAPSDVVEQHLDVGEPEISREERMDILLGNILRRLETVEKVVAKWTK